MLCYETKLAFPPRGPVSPSPPSLPKQKMNGPTLLNTFVQRNIFTLHFCCSCFFLESDIFNSHAWIGKRISFLVHDLCPILSTRRWATLTKYITILGSFEHIFSVFHVLYVRNWKQTPWYMQRATGTKFQVSQWGVPVILEWKGFLSLPYTIEVSLIAVGILRR